MTVGTKHPSTKMAGIKTMGTKLVLPNQQSQKVNYQKLESCKNTNNSQILHLKKHTAMSNTREAGDMVF